MWVQLATWFAGSWIKITLMVAVIAAVVTVVLTAFHKAEKAGENKILKKLDERELKNQNEFNKIQQKHDAAIRDGRDPVGDSLRDGKY